MPASRVDKTADRATVCSDASADASTALLLMLGEAMTIKITPNDKGNPVGKHAEA